MVAKKCETCDFNAQKGQRFCGACKSKLLSQMNSSGYLTRRVRYNSYRSQDMREDTYATKHGGNR